MTKKTLSERGAYKAKIHKALFNNKDLREMLIGDTSKISLTQQLELFNEAVQSHMFIDDTELKAGTYIYYDVQFPTIKHQIKTCELIMYAICNRTVVSDSGSKTFNGDRIDRLTCLIEDCLLNDDIIKEFGIGDLELESANIYNGQKFYGMCFDFVVPNFR